jgi:heme oxygenase
MILNRLRNETNQHHSVLERRLPLFSPQLTLENYRRLLARFYGYYAVLEGRLLAASPSEEIFFDYTGRRKLPFLDHDLLALGSTVTELKSIPRCDDLPI